MESNLDLVKICENAKRILVTGHIKPDGDCIGSTVATTLFLKKKLPDADVRLMIENPAPCFMALSGIETVEPDFAGWKEKTDVCIVIDTNAERIGNAGKFFKEAATTVNIDHHISNSEGSAMINLVDPHASSASEMIYRLIPQEDLDDVIAKYIYMGICHDTGVFRFPNTSPETFRAAAELIGYDFDFSDLIEKTYYEKTYDQMITTSSIVKDARRFCDGKIVFGSVNYKDFTEKKLSPNDFDGAINELRIIKGCELAIFMYPMNESTIKVSLRSIGTVDVSKISERFGGGGHKRAAGFFKKATEEELLKQILDAVKEQTGWE